MKIGVLIIIGCTFVRSSQHHGNSFPLQENGRVTQQVVPTQPKQFHVKKKRKDQLNKYMRYQIQMIDGLTIPNSV